MKNNIISGFIGAVLAMGLFVVSGFQRTQISVLTPAQREVLDTLSVVHIDDCVAGPGYKTLRVTGANLQVVNGLGGTDSLNGLGNLIVGYHETGIICSRTGSHNVVFGRDNNYEGFGGLVGGINNYMRANYSSIVGGENNTIEVTPNTNDSFAVIVGGEWNTTSSEHCAVVGGGFNTIDGSGPDFDAGRWSVIVGGGGSQVADGNTLKGTLSTIVGGNQQLLDDDTSGSVIVGGSQGVVKSDTSVLSGGLSRSIVGGSNDWRAGSLVEDD